MPVESISLNVRELTGSGPESVISLKKGLPSPPRDTEDTSVASFMRESMASFERRSCFTESLPKVSPSDVMRALRCFALTEYSSRRPSRLKWISPISGSVVSSCFFVSRPPEMLYRVRMAFRNESERRIISCLVVACDISPHWRSEEK